MQSFAVCKNNENTKLSGLMCSDFLYYDHAQSWGSKSLLLQSSKVDELEKIHTYSRLGALLYQSIEFISWKNMFNLGGILPNIGNQSRLLFIDFLDLCNLDLIIMYQRAKHMYRQ